MKIYFSASSDIQKENGGNLCNLIVEEIKDCGCEVVTTVNLFDVFGKSGASVEKVSFVKNWDDAAAKTDIAILEVSQPSNVNVGVELMRLLEKGRPVICLYQEGKQPDFAFEEFSNRIIKLEYQINGLHDVIDYGLEMAKNMMNRRFTFYISGRIETYLDSMAKKTGINRSEYIRSLIEERMGSY